MSNHELDWIRADRYIESHLHDESDALGWVLDMNRQAGLPEIDVSPTQGKFLRMMIRMTSSMRVLEVGTLGGYSTLWMAGGLPGGGRIVTLESEALHARVASQNIQRAGFKDQVSVLCGDASATMRGLAENAESFDFMFIDADKTSYDRYFDLALSLSRPGTVLIFDNVIRKAQVLDPTCQDENVQGVQRLFECIRDSTQVTGTALQTVGAKGHDGFAVLRVLGS